MLILQNLKLKQEKIETTKKRLEELNEGITKGNDELANLNATIEIFNKTIADCREWNAEISGNTKTIGKLNKIIDGLQSEIENQIESSGDLSDANAELEEMRKKKEKLQDTKYKLNEQFSYHQVSSELLRDSGIKSKIIKQYLPVINNLTNQYLQTLDFYVHFDLDESFIETIRSRHRDAFTYDSFSEGEKQRIDLSLLFTWRQIAKMKNSTNTCGCLNLYTLYFLNIYSSSTRVYILLEYELVCIWHTTRSNILASIIYELVLCIIYYIYYYIVATTRSMHSSLY